MSVNPLSALSFFEARINIDGEEEKSQLIRFVLLSDTAASSRPASWLFFTLLSIHILLLFLYLWLLNLECRSERYVSFDKFHG